jgi:hypothetical protein
MFVSGPAWIILSAIASVSRRHAIRTYQRCGP